jgi:hypothetical protein
MLLSFIFPPIRGRVMESPPRLPKIPLKQRILLLLIFWSALGWLPHFCGDYLPRGNTGIPICLRGRWLSSYLDVKNKLLMALSSPTLRCSVEVAGLMLRRRSCTPLSKYSNRPSGSQSPAVKGQLCRRAITTNFLFASLAEFVSQFPA